MPPQKRKWKWSNDHGMLATYLSNSVSQYSPAPVVNIVPMLERSWSDLNLPNNALTLMTAELWADHMESPHTRNRKRQWWQRGLVSSHSSNLAGRTMWIAHPGGRVLVLDQGKFMMECVIDIRFVIPPPWSQSESQGRGRGACRRKGKTRWGHQES